MTYGHLSLPADGSVQTPELTAKAGDAIFIGWNQDATTAVTVTDSEGNSYTSASSNYMNTRMGSAQLGYAYAVNIAASSSLAITVRSSSSTEGADVYYIQVTGGGTSVQNTGISASNSISLTPDFVNERFVVFGAFAGEGSPKLSTGTYLNTSSAGSWTSFSGTDTSASAGRLTMPQIVSVVNDTVPEFGLLTVEDGTGLVYQTGTYSATTAKAILNGTSTDHLPLAWGTSETVVSGVAIASDALAASPTGSVLAAAAAYSGNTYFYLSSDGGLQWSQVGSLTGSSPQVAVGPSAIIALTLGGTIPNVGVRVLTVALNSAHTSTSVLITGAFESAVPAWVPDGAMGEETVAATTAAGSVIFYDSVDGGHTFATTTVGSYQAPNSPQTPLAFGAVGSTILVGPAGTAGQLTEAVEGTTIFLLYTTSYEGRTAAATEISSNGGATWTGPWFTALPVGSISNPRAVASPAGDIYVTWTENSHQTPEVDQAVFAADGRLMQPAAPMPDSGGVGNASASSPAVAVDAIEGWVNTTSANASVKNTRQWGTAAGIIGLVAGLSDAPIVLGMLYAELFPPNELQGNPVTAVVVLALDAAVIALGLYLIAHNNVTTAIVVLALALFALTATAYHFLTSELAELPSMRTLGEIDLLISGAATGAVLTDLLIIA